MSEGVLTGAGFSVGSRGTAGAVVFVLGVLVHRLSRLDDCMRVCGRNAKCAASYGF